MGAGLHGFHRDALRAARGEEDHRKIALQLADATDEVQPAHSAHHQIADHHVDVGEVREAVLGRCSLDHPVARRDQRLADGESHRRFVVADEDQRAFEHVTVTLVPPWGRRSYRRLP